MAILQATSHGRLGITVLNKALFYADLRALRDLGHALTDSGFIALPQGPVVNHYERALVRDLDRLRLAEQLPDGLLKPLVVREQIRDFKLLSPEEVGIAQLVGRVIQARSAAWVSDYSHENLAWQHAFRGGVGSPIDMGIAMQQILDDDPWLDEDSPAVENTLHEAVADPGVPFRRSPG